ncbi:MAG: hypothetical protein J6L73_06900 [Muribaculaceae bacterium]|nr:hypothetical protein [Muribaculaceae bacterium]
MNKRANASIRIMGRLIINIREYRRYWPTVVCVLMFTAAFGAWMLAAPPMVDDWIYVHGRGTDFQAFWGCREGYNESLGDALASCAHHYVHSNGRLADKLLILFSMLPQWAGRGLCVIALAVMVFSLLRLASPPGYALRSPLRAALTIVCLLALPPWHQMFAAIAVQFNYILTAAMVLPLCIAFLQSRRIPEAATAVWGIAAGMMHEGLSLPVIGAMVWVFLCKGGLTRQRKSIFLWFLVGSAVMLVAPGTLERSSHAGWSIFDTYFLRNMLVSIPALAVAFAAGCLAICRGWRSKVWRSVSPTGSTAFCLATTAGCLLVAAIVGMLYRTLWFGSIMLIPPIVRAVAQAVPASRQGHNAIALGVSGLCSLLCVAMAAEQSRYAAQQDSIVEKVKASGSAIIYADVTDFSQTSPLMMRIVQSPMPEDNFNLRAIGTSLLSSFTPVIPLPESFRGQHFSQWPRPATDTPLPLYGRWPIYYCPVSPGKSRTPEISLTFDIESAPLSPYNIVAKMRGTQRLTLPIMFDILGVPASEVPDTLLPLFTPEGGVCPDTLIFLYPYRLLRPILYAPVLES